MRGDLDFDDGDDCWTVVGVGPGPAGAVTVRLGATLLSVDAADPTRFVEALVYPTEPKGTPPREDLPLLASLFGPEIAGWLLSARLGDRKEGSVVPGPAWQAVSGLAASELLQEHRRPTSALVTLDAVLHAQRIDHPAARRIVRRGAWAVLPALVAVACTSDRYRVLVDGLRAETRRAFRERVGVVRGVLEEEGLRQRSEDTADRLDQLVAWLEPPTETLDADEIEKRWRRLYEALSAEERVRTQEEQLLLVGPRYEAAPSSASSAPTPSAGPSVPLAWGADVRDVWVRMGDAANALVAGGTCRGSGHIPGSFWVGLPLRLGIEDEDLAEISVRLLTREGVVLGRAPLRVVSAGSELPLAAATVTVQSAEPTVLATVAERGIVVDIAVDGLPDLDRGAIARVTRSQGLRAGQRAAAAAATGQRQVSIEGWHRCAELLRLAGEHDLAIRAEELVEESAQIQADWSAELLTAWAQLVGDVLTRWRDSPLGLNDASELATLVREFSAVVDVAPELADAHALLGRLLLEPNYQSGTEEDEGSRFADAGAHLREAVRIYTALSAHHEARSALRDLRRAS